jgi:hypothetical protein
MGALIAPLLLAAALLAPAATAQTGGSEVQIKAAFLYKFGGFVEWPAGAFASADSPFAIGVLGAGAVAAELERITAGRTVQDRPISLRRVRRGESSGGLHVLFVGREEAARLPEILAAAQGEALLVVTESDNALAHGSVINFVAADEKVRFDVALPAAERGQLRISSRLLAVARKVLPGAS